ncbi:hypothetical protein BCR33DRAFT_715346, partial [Rhizoclosmatium globosum]
MVEITPTDSHESSTFEASLPKGSDSFTVALKGNQTTGYAWELVLPLPTGIEATGDQYSTDQHDTPMVGVPGLHRFSFKKGADSPLSFPSTSNTNALGNLIQSKPCKFESLL